MNATVIQTSKALIIVIRSYMREGERERERESGKGADGIRHKPSICVYTRIHVR